MKNGMFNFGPVEFRGTMPDLERSDKQIMG